MLNHAEEIGIVLVDTFALRPILAKVSALWITIASVLPMAIVPQGGPVSITPAAKAGLVSLVLGMAIVILATFAAIIAANLAIV
jgi:hypothetical protein